MEYCKIYIVAHKEFKVPKQKIYVPIQVGTREDLFKDKGVRDNEGDNIANRNANYCELTAVYWIWKNVKDIDVVGICHYRRYFVKKNFASKSECFLLGEDEIRKILTRYDAIVPKYQNAAASVEKFYYIQGEGKYKDIQKVKEIVANKCPEYMKCLGQVLNGQKAYYCNMVIMKKDKYDAYCKWLFDILFELEKQTDLSEYTKEEARIYGYLSEILLNVWMLKNDMKLKHLPVINTEQGALKYIHGRYLNLLRGIKNIVGYEKSEKREQR